VTCAIPESSSAQPYAQDPGLTVAPSSGAWRKPNGGFEAGAAADPPAAGAEVDAAEAGAGTAPPAAAVSFFWQAASPARAIRAAHPMIDVVFPRDFKFVSLTFFREDRSRSCGILFRR
jgi:hypothetical protein